MKAGASAVMAALASEIEGMERQLALMRRKLVALSAAPAPSAPPEPSVPAAPVEAAAPKIPERKDGEIGPADAVRIALFLFGGKADRAHLTPATHAVAPSKSKNLSVPASLFSSGEIVRHRGAAKGHTIFEISDALKTLRLLKKRSQSYEMFKVQLLKGPERAEQVSEALLDSYGKRAKSFLISDFLRTVETVSDKEIRTAVERSLPRLIAELSAKRAIELTEGQEGFLVSGKPVSRITWLGAS